jgi:hypothetical protein
VQLRIPMLTMLLVSPGLAIGQPYSVGPDIDPGEIKHYVVGTTIGPFDRTDVGITETVYLWIDGAHDMDVYNYSSSNESPDTIGDISWTVSGNGETVAYPIVAASINLYIELASADGTITIDAEVDDLFVLADDGPQHAAQKVLARRVPTGVDVVDHYDVAPAIPGHEANAAAQLMDAKAVFLLEVTPRTVDFKGLACRENIPQQSYLNWPDDGPNTSVGPIKIGVTLATGNTQFPPGTAKAVTNAFQDTISPATFNRSRLVTAASCATCHGNAVFPPGVSIDYIEDVLVPYQFKSGPGAEDFTTIVDAHHIQSFRGADGKCKIKLQASTARETGWQGPWRPIP